MTNELYNLFIYNTILFCVIVIILMLARICSPFTFFKLVTYSILLIPVFISIYIARLFNFNSIDRMIDNSIGRTLSNNFTNCKNFEEFIYDSISYIKFLYKIKLIPKYDKTDSEIFKIEITFPTTFIPTSNKDDICISIKIKDYICKLHILDFEHMYKKLLAYNTNMLYGILYSIYTLNITKIYDKLFNKDIKFQSLIYNYSSIEKDCKSIKNLNDIISEHLNNEDISDYGYITRYNDYIFINHLSNCDITNINNYLNKLQENKLCDSLQFTLFVITKNLFNESIFNLFENIKEIDLEKTKHLFINIKTGNVKAKYTH